MSMCLLDAVRKLLHSRPYHIKYADIAQATNCNVNDIKRLGCGKAEGMPVRKVQAVYEYLAGRPLISDCAD